jgi:cytochrome P450
VIADFLSIPVSREADVKRWSDDSVAAIGVNLSTERALEAARGIVEMQNFLASLVEERRRAPQDDFLTELTVAEFEDAEGVVRKLEIPEMLSIIQQLMVAGNEATTKGITEIMKLLVQHPAAWKRIQEDPSTIPAMTEEGLRLASPNQGLFRICTEDTEVMGVSIPKGAMLWAMFGSANRDERVFEDPDRFDPGRTNLKESLAFGRGAHFCIGAPLARLEVRVLYEELAKHVDTIAFAPGTTLEYEPSFILRGLKALEIDIVRK